MVGHSRRNVRGVWHHQSWGMRFSPPKKPFFQGVQIVKRFVVILVALLLVLVAFGLTNAQAAVQFMDINFDGDSIGSSPATGSLPSLPGALGGFTATDYFSPPTAANGTILVQGSDKAAVFSSATTNGAVGALFMDTGFSVHSQQITLGFDINVLASPSSLTGQVLPLDGGAAGVLFGARIWNASQGKWAFSFQVAPTSDVGGVFALRDAANAMTSFGSYQNGEEHHVAIVGDCDMGTATVYLDGSLVLSGFPLRGGIASNVTFSELFMYLNGQEGYSNQVAIDNIVAYDFNAVPEPATCIVWSIFGGIGVFAGWRRRKMAA